MMRDLTIVSGDWSSFAGRRDAAIVGRSVAQRRGIAVGDQFTIGDISVQVAGIFSSSVAAEENLIYTSLEFLQYSFGQDRVGLVTQLEVALADDADPDAVARQIDERLKAGPVATTTRTRGAFQASTLADLVDLIGFAHWLGFACVGLVFALVAATTVMSVQDRVKEHAVLQTLGVRPSRVFRLIVAESLVLCLAGGIVGTAAAALLLAWGGFAIGAEGATIAFRPSFSLAALGVGVSLLVGLFAGLLPALNAARTPIVQALREA
jgi:putative ABC transport system permease protein